MVLLHLKLIPFTFHLVSYTFLLLLLNLPWVLSLLLLLLLLLALELLTRLLILPARCFSLFTFLVVALPYCPIIFWEYAFFI